MSNIQFLGGGKVLFSDELKKLLNEEPVKGEIIVKMILQEPETIKLLEDKYNSFTKDFPFIKSFLPTFEKINEHLQNYINQSLEREKNE